MKELKSGEFLDKQIKELKRKVQPGMKIAFVTDFFDNATEVYIKQKVNLAKKLGVEPLVVDLTKEDRSPVKVVKDLVNQKIPLIIQSPLVVANEKELTKLIPSSLDIDGQTNNALVGCFFKENTFKPCTPEGIIELLKSYDIDLEGKNVLIIGRSRIVGIPLAGMLLGENASVKIDHSHTPIRELTHDLKKADIICSQVGIPNFFGVKDIKDNAIVVDISMNRNQEGKLCGDFSDKDVESTNIQYTPVPGGVGPMTVYELLKHAIQAQERAK